MSLTDAEIERLTEKIIGCRHRGASSVRTGIARVYLSGVPYHRAPNRWSDGRKRTAYSTRVQGANHQRRAETRSRGRRLYRCRTKSSRTSTSDTPSAGDYVSQANGMSRGTPHELQFDNPKIRPETPRSPGPIQEEDLLISSLLFNQDRDLLISSTRVQDPPAQDQRPKIRPIPLPILEKTPPMTSAAEGPRCTSHLSSGMSSPCLKYSV